MKSIALLTHSTVATFILATLLGTCPWAIVRADTVLETETAELGQKGEWLVTDGKLNAEEYTVPLTEVPAAAKAAIEAGARGAVIKRVQHITRAGKVTYEALYVAKGKETEVEYLEDGSLKP